MQTATSLEGYKYTLEVKAKMVARVKDKANHLFYNKNHSFEAKKLISKKAELNPVALYGKSHSFEAKKLISLRR